MDYEALMSVSNEKNRFAVYNGILIKEVSLDRAVGELNITDDSLNLMGIVHGGAYFTLADVTAGAVARSNGLRHATLDSSFHFIRSAKSGTLRATGRTIHRGRTTCLVGVEVTDADGNLVAEGRFNMFCFGQPSM